MTPWEILEVGQDAQVRDIKRAYARKLKSCRPDDDPEGFQRLVEAREEALWMAENRDFIELFEEEDEEDEAPALEEKQQAEPGSGHDKDGNGNKAKEEPAIDSGTALAEASGKEDPDQERAGQAEDKNEQLFDQATALLEKLSGPWSRFWQREDWQDVIKIAGKLDLAMRQYLEGMILDTLGQRFAKHHDLKLRGPEGEEVQGVLRLLDDEFQWSFEDVRLYDFLSWQDADHILMLLRAQDRGEGAAMAAIPGAVGQPDTARTGHSGETERGIPFLNPVDVAHYFGKSPGSYPAYIEKAIQINDWPVSFSFVAAIFPLFWLAYRSLWKWFGIFALLYLGRKLANHYAVTHDLTELRAFLPAVFLAAAVWLGFSAKRLVTLSVQRAIAQADERGLTGDERQDWLEEAGRPSLGIVVLLLVLVSSFLLIIMFDLPSLIKPFF